MSKDTRFSTGEMGDTAFADALIGALQKKTEKENVAKENVVKDVVAATAPALPDLDKIEASGVILPTLEGNKEQIRVEAEGGRQWAEAAGAKIVQLNGNIEKIQVEIRKIEKDPNSKFSATAQNLLAQLKAAETRERGKLDQIMSVKNDALKSHMEFSALLEEIRGTDPTHLGEVRELIDRVVKMGRYKLATAAEIDAAKKPESRWPSGAIFFESKVYFSIVDASKSNGQRALEAELRKLIDAAKFSKAASIKMCGNADLSGFKSGKPGTYYFFNPKRTESDGRKFFEGHALVEIRDVNHGKFVVDRGQKVKKSPFIVVQVKDAIGSLSRLVSDRWVPHFWVDKGKVVSNDRLEEDDFLHAINVIKTLRAIFVIWQEGLNPEAAKPKEEKPEGPAVNPVMNTDMTGIVVETKHATAVKAEKPKKVIKKA